VQLYCWNCEEKCMRFELLPFCFKSGVNLSVLWSPSAVKKESSPWFFFSVVGYLELWCWSVSSWKMIACMLLSLPLGKLWCWSVSSWKKIVTVIVIVNGDWQEDQRFTFSFLSFLSSFFFPICIQCATCWRILFALKKFSLGLWMGRASVQTQ